MSKQSVGWTVHPVGFARTPFREAAGTPVQPRAAAGARGTIEFSPDYAEGLLDLEGFERIWVITWYDRAAAPRMLVTPYLDTARHGLFATRAPARPNPIGISCVKLERIEGTTLHVSEVDLLDGTPVLDVKPYVPAFDSWPAAKAGWVDAKRVEGGTADGRFERT